MYLFLICDITH